MGLFFGVPGMMHIERGREAPLPLRSDQKCPGGISIVMSIQPAFGVLHPAIAAKNPTHPFRCSSMIDIT